MNTRTEQSIVEAAVAALNDLGLHARARNVTKAEHADAVVTVRRDGKAFRFLAEVKRRLTPAMIGPVSLAISARGEDRLLITDYATPPIADALRHLGIQFADTAGNVFLNRMGLLVIVTGRTPKAVRPRTMTPRVFRRSGLKILFALLSDPALVSSPQRTIADAANVSLGSLAPFLEGLRELGFLAEIRGTRRLVDRGRLIDQWTEGYARTLQPSLESGRFRANESGWWRRVNPTSYDVLWGGETAAAVLQRNLIPQQTILYGDALPAKLLAGHRLKADPNGDVVFRKRFWNAAPSPRADVVPAVLIYADLLATGDGRSLAAAKQIREKYLD